ncbi:DNA-binding protein [Mycolicibacter sp. MYC123]|uniref:DNA-binding protein n=1 Tax=[Mycobacterium] zoologicum TaxID=2872311 RepID=A0ABU5YPZ2_9MYCO|nr:DNA-binding protein [Mycolicibacter sp. MYC123]MEB3052138.1 DNA-binding protein [Mycolicibacter sp. MYC123]
MTAEDEVDFLADHGGDGTEAVISEWSAEGERQARARVALQALTSAVAGSVSAKEAAEILGVDSSRISRRLGKSLWGFGIDGQRRIPRWQFLDSAALLPGLDVIVPAIPRGVTPAVLEAFMRTPQADFDEQTPIEYLVAGGDPRPVAELVADLGRW